MIENIIERENCFPRIAREIKNSGLPLLFYILYYSKNSIAEKELYQLCLSENIRIDNVVIDKKYLNEKELFEGNIVYDIDDILTKHDSINVFVAFVGDDESIKEKLLKTNRVQNVFFYDGGNGDSFGIIKNYTIKYDYVRDNLTEFEWVYNNLDDELSRKTMCAFFNQRISGDRKYIKEVYNPFDSQYFPTGIINLSANEIFVDCGACIGSAVDNFLKQLKSSHGSYYKIYAFEPDSINFEKLNSKYAGNEKISLIHKGVWHKNEVLKFNSNGPSSMISDFGNKTIVVDAIDSMVSTDEHISFIKMDVEGAEYEALRGAEKTIRKNKPKLAISVYHKQDDLLIIPAYIKRLEPNYRLYLRAHRYRAMEVVLYAVNKNI